MNKEILLNIITGLDFIDNLYDIIRLVDPREKKYTAILSLKNK
jgi:hypothetical protein